MLHRWAACPSVFLWASAGTGTGEAPPGPRPATWRHDSAVCPAPAARLGSERPASVRGAEAAPGGAVGCVAAGARGGNLEPGLSAEGPPIPGTTLPPPRPVFSRPPLDCRGPHARCRHCSLSETPPPALREPQLNTACLSPAPHTSFTPRPLPVPYLRAGLPRSCPQKLGGGQTPRKPNHWLLCASNTLPQVHTPVNTDTATRARAARAASHTRAHGHTLAHTPREDGAAVGVEAAPTPQPLGLCFGAAGPWTEGGRQDAWAPLC